MISKTAALIGALLLAGINTTMAEAYVGVSLGLAGSNFCDNVDPYYACDSSGIGAKAFGGYKVVPSFAIEAASISSVGTSISNDQSTVDLSMSGLNLSGVYFHPISDTVNLTAKAGMFFWKADAAIGSYSVATDGSDLSFGFGADFKMSDSFTLRTELDRFSLGSDSLTLFTAGAMWSF